MSGDNRERLSSIEEKLNTLIALLEGKHGAEGLAAQIYRNREDIKALKRFVYKMMGSLGILIPIATYLIRYFIIK
jgi:hypothetical protein